MPMSGPLEIFDHFLAFLQPDKGFLPIGPVSRALADAPCLAGPDLRPDGVHLHLEKVFDGLLDFGLVGAPGDGEADLVVPLLQDRAFFGCHGTEDDLGGILAHWSLSIKAVNASRPATNQSWPTTSWVLTRDGSTGLTLGMFRRAMNRFLFAPRSTTRAEVTFKAFKRDAPSLVL